MYMYTTLNGRYVNMDIPDIQVLELFWVEVVNLSSDIQNVLHSVKFEGSKSQSMSKTSTV